VSARVSKERKSTCIRFRLIDNLFKRKCCVGLWGKVVVVVTCNLKRANIVNYIMPHNENVYRGSPCFMCVRRLVSLVNTAVMLYTI